MAWVFLGVGLTLVVEGLIWALAPQMVERFLLVVRGLPMETRRLAGLAALALGLALVWAGRMAGGFPL
ncbi:DUF2065 family protein [Rubellimicrobium roseum]|uniref:DUF2065 family protein n=1 Tax=Rubellimicrobium roseum TaxID=687525 RepID=A0A5C4NB99_9RHOB|nr:DUF2065 family protein [Rubellimicrobium roseum]TNC70866.1 DUF2065 family protein [Rubellimicrobium roseum]